VFFFFFLWGGSVPPSDENMGRHIEIAEE